MKAGATNIVFNSLKTLLSLTGRITVKRLGMGVVVELWVLGTAAAWGQSPTISPNSASVDRNNFYTDDAGNISLTTSGDSGTTIRWFADGCGRTDIGTGNNLNIASPAITTTFYASWESDPRTPSACANVTISDMNEFSVEDSVQLHGMLKTWLVIPEAISPNGDLINDVWNIKNTGLYSQIEITIYNRWGQAVWKSDRGYPIPWDGRSKGEELPIDSYHYVIDLHNGSKPIIGTITIIR
jgi:gliding motility-associated-like protein